MAERRSITEPPQLDPDIGRPPWMRWAACRGMGARLFIVAERHRPEAGKAVCERCPVRSECLEYAVADPDLQGLWGGTSTKERIGIRTARRKAMMAGPPEVPAPSG